MVAAYCAEATRRETSTIMQLVMMTASEERVKAESEFAHTRCRDRTGDVLDTPTYQAPRDHEIALRSAASGIAAKKDRTVSILRTARAPSR